MYHYATNCIQNENKKKNCQTVWKVSELIMLQTVTIFIMNKNIDNKLTHQVSVVLPISTHLLMDPRSPIPDHAIAGTACEISD